LLRFRREVEMRLAPKIFASSTLVILALIGIAGCGLLAVKRLVEAHREIASRSLPALQLEASLREATPRLLRLEARYLVLRDRTYESLLMARAADATAELERLGPLLTSPAEQAMHRDAGASLASYRRHLEEERALLARGRDAQALQLSEGPARSAAQQLEQSLAALTATTWTEINRAQVAVRALEMRTWTAVLITLSLSLVAALGTTGLVVLRTTRSIRRLSAATARVAEGNFAEPVEIDAGDEVGELTKAFNRMAERLRELDTLKQRFFSHMSHEMRSPLTVISSACQLMRQRAQHPLDDKQRRWIDLIEMSAARSLELVNAILDFNRLRARVFPLDRHAISLDKVAARAVDMLRPQAEQRGLQVDEEMVGDDFVAMVDEEALTKVITNLVGNAIKFTPSGGLIRVVVTDAADHVEVAVRDTGDGIPSAILPLIFEPYRQAHRGRKGSGLGLAIVKELVEVHAGTVNVESTEGVGSCFTVRLPRSVAPAA
jgi:signal transduction histidine kinase